MDNPETANLFKIQSDLYEVESKLKLLEKYEAQIQYLKDENFVLSSEKNKIELELKILIDKHDKSISELKNEINYLTSELDKKKQTNKSLFDEKEQIQLHNFKLQQDITNLLHQNEALEFQITNLNSQISTYQKENKQLITDNKNLTKICKKLNIKLTNESNTYSSYQKEDICNFCFNDKNKKPSEINETILCNYIDLKEFVYKLIQIKNDIIKENYTLKEHIMILTSQNEKLIKEIDSLGRGNGKILTLEQMEYIVDTNRNLLTKSLEAIEKVLEKHNDNKE